MKHCPRNTHHKLKKTNKFPTTRNLCDLATCLYYYIWKLLVRRQRSDPEGKETTPVTWSSIYAYCLVNKEIKWKLASSRSWKWYTHMYRHVAGRQQETRTIYKASWTVVLPWSLRDVIGTFAPHAYVCVCEYHWSRWLIVQCEYC